MSVKQAAKVYVGKWEKEKKLRAGKAVLHHGVTFLLGILFSLSGFNGSFSPFGAAFTASVPKELTLTAAAGASLGWFIGLDSVSALRYTSVVLALCVIMSALKPFGQLRDNPATPVICTFVCLFVTGLAIAFSNEVTVLSVLLCFAEGAIGGAASFLFYKCQTALSLKGGVSMLTSKETTAVTVAVMLLLLSLRDLSVFGIYPAHIITGFLILICAFYGKEAGGAVVGVCGGITASLGGGDAFLMSFYSFGGLLAGVFSVYGRLASFAAFIFSGVAVAAVSYDDFENPLLLIEFLVSGIAFLIVSKKFDSKISAILRPAVTSPVIDTVKGDIFRKLKKASEISAEICGSLTSVNEAFSKSEKGDIKNISGKTRERVCGSCGLYDVCWKENFEDTSDAFNTLLCLKKEGVFLEYKTVPQRFSGKCIRTENVASSFNKLYGEYLIRERMQSRFQEMHSLAAEQFVNVSGLLDSLCEKIDDEVRFDMDSAARVRAAAASCGFEPLECSCVINSFDKMTLELKLKNAPSGGVISNLSKHIGIITGRKTELPVIERCDEYTRMTFKEKADYKIISSGVQSCARGERFSGDTFSTFEDDNGLFYAVICDGMGTGTRAALVSSLAVTLLEKLIKAGFGIKAAISTVNTSLISRSGEESSVTLDLTVIDSFTGHVRFFKCGAAETTVKKNGRILNVGFSSLPLGILSCSEASCGSGTLSEGDILIMSSDGVREEDKPYLQKELRAFSGGNVREFTTELCENIRRYQPEKQDDLTVLTLAVTKND